MATGGCDCGGRDSESPRDTASAGLGRRLPSDPVSRSQRLTFLAIAGVIAVVAAVMLAGGSGEGSDEQVAGGDAVSATMTPTPESEGMADEAEATETPTPEPLVLLRSGAEPKTVEARQGERVRFQIRSSVDEELHLHGYDLTRPLPAGRAVTITIPDPQITGILEIELHGSGEQIGSLEVRPG